MQKDLQRNLNRRERPQRPTVVTHALPTPGMFIIKIKGTKKHSNPWNMNSMLLQKKIKIKHF